MSLGPYFVGQIPKFAIVMTVKDPDSNAAKNLSSFNSVEVRLEGPGGNSIDTTAGTAIISDALNGEVTYSFPSTSLFDKPGDYQLQLKLTDGTFIDYTTAVTFEVLRTVGT